MDLTIYLEIWTHYETNTAGGLFIKMATLTSSKRRSAFCSRSAYGIRVAGDSRSLGTFFGEPTVHLELLSAHDLFLPCPLLASPLRPLYRREFGTVLLNLLFP